MPVYPGSFKAGQGSWVFFEMECEFIKRAYPGVKYELVYVLRRMLGLLCAEQMEVRRRGRRSIKRLLSWSGQEGHAWCPEGQTTGSLCRAECGSCSLLTPVPASGEPWGSGNTV